MLKEPGVHRPLINVHQQSAVCRPIINVHQQSAVCMYAIVLVHIDLPNEIVLYAAADPGFLKGGV